MRSATPAARFRQVAALSVRLLVGFVLFLLTGWGVLAIYYSNLPSSVRPFVAGSFGVSAVVLLCFVRPRRRGVATYGVVCALLIAWWLAIPPSNERNWQPDLAVTSWAEIDDSKVTIHGIRDCEYRSETDYTVRRYDKTVDIAKLDTVDLFLVYWGSPSIAHTMMSFGFEDESYICFSIETRKEVGEAYSAIKGFFKQFELIYVVADERDVVRLRTNFRHEDVYLYRLNATPEVARKVFLDYLREVNRLHAQAQWYNALTSNCTTNIRGHTAPYNPNARWDWRILINGYVDEMAYERGSIDRSLPFQELKRRSHINERAIAAGSDPGFSRLIRAGLPGFETDRIPPLTK